MLDRRALAASGLVVAALAVTALATHVGATEPAHVDASPRGRALRTLPPRAALRALRDGDRLDLNTASASALELLPGIGPALSARIVQDREQRGRFANVDALTRVRGIGPRTLTRVRPLLRVQSSKTNTTAPNAVR